MFLFFKFFVFQKINQNHHLNQIEDSTRYISPISLSSFSICRIDCLSPKTYNLPEISPLLCLPIIGLGLCPIFIDPYIYCAWYPTFYWWMPSHSFLKSLFRSLLMLVEFPWESDKLISILLPVLGYPLFHSSYLGDSLLEGIRSVGVDYIPSFIFIPATTY